MGSIIIAGVTSSVGKTTVAVGIMDALRRRGLEVQPFKVGPDYIDPGHHTASSGNTARVSRNLDTWMMPTAAVLELYHRAMIGADVGVVEGVMGLFDGYSGREDVGSTAHVARLLKAPVVLIVDVSHTARSAAATVIGFQRFDQTVELSGVILNNVGSAGHLRAVAEAIGASSGLPVLGYLHRSPNLVLPHRHLGLVPAAEGPPRRAFQEKLAQEVENNFDIDAILRLARGHHPPPPSLSGLFPEVAIPPRVNIAVARDEAFSFYYQDNLDLLAAWGSRLAAFSPLHDAKLPPSIGGIYIGGGFPEVFAATLSANQSLMNDIRMAAQKGMPIYGECGGLMYLGQAIVDFGGRRHPMVGVAPGEAVMKRSALSLGYAEVEARASNPLMEASERARGHEFHYSEWQGDAAGFAPAYSVLNRAGRLAGFVRGNILASYVHLHFASNPKLAPRFVDTCATWRDAAPGPISA